MDEIENDPKAPQGLAAMLGRTLARTAFIGGDLLPGLRKGLEYLPKETIELQAGEWTDYLAKKLTNKDEVALVRDPVPLLASLFFQDLNEIAQKRKVLLCFENFEATQIALEDWFLHLREYKPSQNVRIVIAGRHKPGANWEQLRSVTKIILLDVFTEQEAEIFLDVYGITDARRRAEIIECSGRLPVLMSWLAAPEAKEPDPSIPTYDIVDRFLRWITEIKLRQVALLAALPRTFNIDILKLLLENQEQTIDKQLAFDWLQTMPFVRQCNDGWQYHDIVRRMMLHYQRKTSPQNYRQMHATLAKFYNSRRLELACSEEEQWHNEEWCKNTLAYIYHRLAAEPLKHWGELMSLLLMALRERQSFAIEITELMGFYDSHDEMSREQQDTVQLCHQQMQALKSGDLEDSFEMFNRLCNITSLSTRAKCYVLSYHGECYRRKGKWEEALKDFEAALQYLPQDPWILANRSQLYLSTSRYPEALTDLADLERALKLASSPQHALTTRSTLLIEDRPHEEVPAGGIQAEGIKATNVVSGTQIIHVPQEQGQKLKPPLQRPRRAEYYTDREEEVAQILRDLQPGRIVTVCGPGGIGKTALIAEALWILTPSNTPPVAFPDGILFHSFYNQPATAVALEQIARAFGEEPFPTPALAAQRALSGRRVILVLDGAERADNLEQMLSVCRDCAVLVTSRRRADAADPAYRLDLHPLPLNQAVTMLRAWGGKWASDEVATTQISAIMGGHPLALRLVGRYLSQYEEEASEYLQWLKEATISALDQGPSERESIRVLLERSIARVSIDAQQVLTVIGLLALAPFDRELIAKVLNLSSEKVSRVLGELVNYGLAVRLDSRYEVSHPLIHTYAHELLLRTNQLSDQHFLAQRIVLVLNELFPEATFANWDICQSLLPHAEACATLVDHYEIYSVEAAHLFNHIGWFLRERARFSQAQILFLRALSISEKTLGPDYLDTAIILHNLAILHQDLGQYTQAEAFYQRSLAIKEKRLGPNHPGVGITLDNLAELYRVQGRYKQAEPLFLQALSISEKTLGPDHPDTAAAIHNLAGLYRAQGQFALAEPLYQRVLAIVEKTLGPDHPDTATALQNLAGLYQDQGQFALAEPLYQRVLAIVEKTLGPDHPVNATVLENYANLLQNIKQDTEAAKLKERARTIRAKLVSS